MGEIYLITNKINGKRYVGQTVYTTYQRWTEHIQDSKRNRSNSILHKAIQKYGKKSFIVKPILINIAENDLDRLESIWIKRLDTFIPHGYNMTTGGVGVRHYRHTDATKKKLSEKIKGTSLNHGKAISDGFKRNNSMEKRSNNPNWRKHISESRMGKYTKFDNGFYGKHHSDFTKQHLRELKSKPVGMYSLDGELIQVFENGYVARDYLLQHSITNNNSCESLISKVCRELTGYKTAYGFIWRFEDKRCRD